MPIIEERIRKAATPITVVDGQPVRPGEVLLDANATDDVRTLLKKAQGRRYYSDDPADWRRAFAPSVSIGDELQSTRLELWTGLLGDAPLELVNDDNVPGIHYNSVYFGTGAWDFYHGGPGGRPAIAPRRDRLPSGRGEGRADLAILDTGLPSGWQRHPAHLTAVRGIDAVQSPTDLLDEDKDARADLQAGHGIFICGLVRQAAPDVGIEMYRVLSSTGEGDEATIIATLNNVRGSSARVVSLSFGGFPTNGVEPPLAATIRELRKAGKVVVAAAGNAQEDPEFRGRTMFPASMPEVIAVGAYDSTEDEPTLWPHSNPADVYSVGVDLVSTYVGWSDGRHVPTLDAWARWSGSSFATPLVAARYAAEDGLRLADIGEEAAGDWPRKSAWPQTMSSTESETPRRYDLKINLTA